MEYQNGKVRWFDSLSGQGMVAGSDGRLYFLHFTAIEGVNKNNHHWPLDSDRDFLGGLGGKACTFKVTCGQADSVSIADNAK